MVIGIIGILAASVYTLLNPAAQIQKANDARRKSDLAQLQRTLETYYSDNGTYPDHSSSPNAYRIVDLGGTTIAWGGTWDAYKTTLPKDPDSTKNYAYISTGQAYYLYASLDRNNDVQLCSPGGARCTNAPATTVSACGTGGTGKICNYGVSSSNVSP